MTPFERLTEIVETLCSENGCPWDQAQTYHSLRSSLIEETYEIIEAIETENLDQFCEELGDLLSVIMLLSQIAKDDGDFDIDQVIGTIAAGSMMSVRSFVKIDGKTEVLMRPKMGLHKNTKKSRSKGLL